VGRHSVPWAWPLNLLEAVYCGCMGYFSSQLILPPTLGDGPSHSTQVSTTEDESLVSSCTAGRRRRQPRCPGPRALLLTVLPWQGARGRGIAVLPHVSCVVLGQLPNLLESQFPQLGTVAYNSYLTGWLWISKEAMSRKTGAPAWHKEGEQ
jgi:hypothetical protein